MSKDYAALLAQVVPVIALAAGIELRAWAKRLGEAVRNPLVGDRNTAFRLVVFVALCGALPSLAVVEESALARVRDQTGSSGGGFPYELLLASLMLLALALPAHTAIMNLIVGRKPEYFEGSEIRLRVAGFLVTCYLTLSTLAIGSAIAAYG